ncbi:MAG: FkbM family methyltransferase [Synechococcaceae cyanobacterium]|jgi:FkbM family methyltransferase
MKVIYDIGANNGDDIQYYLKKADRVVAVEANPSLCDIIRTKFRSEIANGTLVVENCVLTPHKEQGTIPFYIHTKYHGLSQVSRPKNNQSDYEKVLLPRRSVESLFAKHGYPHYVKIDVEGYDHVILRSMFANSIFPQYISAESHVIEVFLLLSCSGRYNHFKLVEGYSVPDKYGQHIITTIRGAETYSFPMYSSGPYGEDLDGEWMPAKRLFKLLTSQGLGWKDIHAMNQDLPASTFKEAKIKYYRLKLQWIASRIRIKLSKIFARLGVGLFRLG